MWANFDRHAYTREEFAARVAGLTWSAWKPVGICLHNTSAPTLKQWAESGPAHDQRILNLQSYYEGMGWHAGPHLFISRNFINGFSDLTRSGVHSTCFNSTHIGIEMVGDFDSEEFNTGDGAMVRDNAVFAMALLHKKLGLDPNNLAFHRDCKRDNHACPGSKVSKVDIIQRVAAAMGAVAAPPPIAPAGAQPIAALDRIDAIKRLQKALADLGSDPGPIDGLIGTKTRNAARAVLGL